MSKPLSREEVIGLSELLGRVTRALAGQKIKVIQRGAIAMVEFDRVGAPTKVVLPVIDEHSPRELYNALRGFVDHEVAHLLFTDFKLSARKLVKAPFDGNSVAKALQNILEDCWIEKAMRERFQGSEQNLSDTRQFVIDRAIEPARQQAIREGRQQDLPSILSAAAARAVFGQKEFIAYMKDKWAEAGELGMELMKMERDIRSIRTTQDSFFAAEELLRRLSSAPPPPEQEKQKGGGDKKDKPKKDKPKQEEPKQEEQGEGDQQEEQGEPEQGEGDEDQQENEPEPGEKGGKPEQEDEESDDGEGDGDGEGAESEDADGDDDDQCAGDKGDEDESGDGDDDGAGDDAGDDDAGDDDAGDDDADGKASSGLKTDDDAEDTDDDTEDGDGDESSDGDDGDGDDGKDSEATPEYNHDEPSETNGEQTGAGAGRGLAALNGDQMADLDKALGEAITNLTAETRVSGSYLPYTREYDFVGEWDLDNEVFNGTRDHARSMGATAIRQVAEKNSHVVQQEITRTFMAQTLTRWQYGQKRGRINTAALARVRTGDDKVFRQKMEVKDRGLAVSLLCDLSGSMQGGSKLPNAIIAAYTLSHVLDKIGIKHEVAGFTTSNPFTMNKLGLDYDRFIRDRYFSNESQNEFLEAGGYGTYSRRLGLAHLIFKGFDQRFTEDRRRDMCAMPFAGMATCQGNLDGENVEIAAHRLMAVRGVTRRVLIVMSDGMPAADGPEQHYVDHLLQTVDLVERSGIEIHALGLKDESVRRFYKRVQVINKVEEIPTAILAMTRQMVN